MDVGVKTRAKRRITAVVTRASGEVVDLGLIAGDLTLRERFHAWRVIKRENKRYRRKMKEGRNG